MRSKCGRSTKVEEEKQEERSKTGKKKKCRREREVRAAAFSEWQRGW